jgi:hypothetical protein
MAAKLTVIFYIMLCLEAGMALTFLPWTQPFGLGDWWGDNYFLLLAVQKTGFEWLRDVVASGWVRGAVTGLGLVNIAFALREIILFPSTVRAIDGIRARPEVTQIRSSNNAVQSAEVNHISHHERRDDLRDRIQ